MKEFSVPMAAVDFIPVFLFLAAAIILLRVLRGKMKPFGYVVFALGDACIFLAGFLKALYKLLYASGVGDFPLLSAQFMPMQSVGFLLAGVALLAFVCSKRSRAMAAAAPASLNLTPVYISLMVLGLIFMNISLTIMAARKKKPFAAALYIIALVGCMCMGYLSSQDFDKAFMNWVAEGINVIAQGSLLAGTVILSKAYKMLES